MFQSNEKNQFDLKMLSKTCSTGLSQWALVMLETSWEKVTTNTIKNCYRKVGFVSGDLIQETPEEDDPEHVFTVETTAFAEEMGSITMDEYINTDSLLETAFNEQDSRRDDCNDVQNDEVQQETVSDDDADEINQVPTVSDAINALSTIQSFLENSEGGYDHLKNLEMSDFVFKIKNQRVSQSNITDYFQSG